MAQSRVLQFACAPLDGSKAAMRGTGSRRMVAELRRDGLAVNRAQLPWPMCAMRIEGRHQ